MTIIDAMATASAAIRPSSKSKKAKTTPADNDFQTLYDALQNSIDDFDKAIPTITSAEQAEPYRADLHRGWTELRSRKPADFVRARAQFGSAGVGTSLDFMGNAEASAVSQHHKALEIAMNDSMTMRLQESHETIVFSIWSNEAGRERVRIKLGNLRDALHRYHRALTGGLAKLQAQTAASLATVDRLSAADPVAAALFNAYRITVHHDGPMSGIVIELEKAIDVLLRGRLRPEGANVHDLTGALRFSSTEKH